MAAFMLLCQSSNMREFRPEGSLSWALSRLRTQAMSKGSSPVYLP